MTKTSSLFQRNLVCITLICFMLLRSGSTRNYFSDLDLSSQTLNPAVTGFTINGNADQDRLGYSVKTAGDIDKDGYDDIIIGAYYKNGRQGAVYVIYGGAEPTMSNLDLSSSATLNPLTTGFMLTGGAAGDQFGWSVSTAGDINKDGYADIIVGAPGKNVERGTAYVVYGGPRSSMSNRDFSSGATLIPSTTGFMITGSTTGDILGYSVGTAGDIDKDGYDDIIVGAYYKDNGRGAAYVIYGGPKSTRTNINLSSTTLSPSSTGFKITGQTVGDNFGSSVSTAGDIDKDGYDDIIIGAKSKNNWQGAAYVIYGGPRATRSNWDFSSGAALSPGSTGFKITGSAGKNYLGVSVSTAGDINNDGYDDIIVGAQTKDNYRGAAYVIYGGTRATRSNWDFNSATLTPSTTGFMITGNANNDELGVSVSTAGDINKDGYDDIIVGAYYKSTGGTAYVIYGGPKSTRTNIALSSTALNPLTTGFTIRGSVNGWLGFSVSTAGDVNKDGYDDIIVSAPLKDTYRGAVYVIYASCSPKCTQCSSETACTACKSPYHLYQFNCLDSCPPATFLDASNTCEDCSAHCNKCSDASVCTECQSSYFMYKSECFATCPVGTIATSATTCEEIQTFTAKKEFSSSSERVKDCPANCDSCSSTSVCTQCSSSYHLYQSECFASCPVTTFADTETTCQDCPSNCNQCSRESICTECESSYLIYESECFASCPETTFAATETTCEDCSDNCNHCSSASVCTECQSPYLMYQSECFASCPVATFAATETTCEDCSDNCNHCSNASVCTECQSPYLMYESECFASCPETTFAATETTCEDCSDNCNHCSSASVCTECQSPYLMYQSECFASCPVATFAATETTCEDCSANCHHCSDASVCTECQRPYYLYQSECFASCPVATFAATETTCEDCMTNCNQCISASVCTECKSWPSY